MPPWDCLRRRRRRRRQERSSAVDHRPRLRIMDASRKIGYFGVTGPSQMTPKEHWAEGMKIYNVLPRSWLKKGGWMSPEEFSNYVKKATESQGFDVSGCSGGVCDGIIEVCSKTNLRAAAKAAKYAVEKHNSDTGANLKFVEIVKANCSLLSMVVFYLTLRALDEYDQPQLYRTKVLQYARHRKEAEIYGRYVMQSFNLAPGYPQEVHGGDQQKRSKKPRRPFHIYVEDLKKQPEFLNAGYSEVMRAARAGWEALPPKEKAVYEEEVASTLLMGVQH